LTGLVIGIGNGFRRDDGVGLAVANEVARRHLPGVEVMTAIGEPGAILDAWAGVPTVVVVDAAVSADATPGRIRRWTPDAATDSPATSSHSLGLAQTYALARALGRLPGRLAVLTVDIVDCGLGPGLSAPVAACVTDAVDAVLAELVD
jgi:hydrogenase maturation protease